MPENKTPYTALSKPPRVGSSPRAKGFWHPFKRKKPITHIWAASRLRRLLSTVAVKVVVSALVIATMAGYVAHQKALAQETVETWGETRAILVATKTIQRGQIIEYDSVEFPIALIPNTSIEPSTDVLETALLATRTVDAGQIITTSLVAGAESETDQPLPGEVAVTFTAVHLKGDISAGAIVDIWQVRNSIEHTSGQGSSKVANYVRVLEVDKGLISVSIDAENAPRLIEASVRPLVVAVTAP